MTTTPDTVPYDHIGVVRMGGALGTTRYVDVPQDWVISEQVGLLLGAPDNVTVTVDGAVTVPLVEGGGVTGFPEPDPADLLDACQVRYEAAVHVLAHLMHKPAGHVEDIVQVRPHLGTLLDGREVSDRVAQVLVDVDAYIADHEWPDR